MVVLEVSYRGRTRRLRLAGGEVTIGAAQGCTLRVPEPEVGPIRASLLLEGAGPRRRPTLRLVDHQTGSAPLRVNGEEVLQARLRPGDRITLGPLTVHVQAPGPALAAGRRRPEPRSAHCPPERPAAQGSLRWGRAWLAGAGLAAAAAGLLLLWAPWRREPEAGGSSAPPPTAAVPPVPDLPAGPHPAAPVEVPPEAAPPQPQEVRLPPQPESPPKGKAAPPPAAAPRPAGGQPGGAPAPAAAPLDRTTLERESLAADQAVQRHDFAGALARYRKLLQRAPAGYRPLLAPRIRELERLTRAREAVAARLKGGGGPRLVTRGLGAFHVLGLTPAGDLRIGTATETRTLPWADLPPEGMAALFRWAFPGAEGWFLAGVYLFEHRSAFGERPDLEREAHRSLHRALTLDPSRIQAVHAFLSRVFGVRPEGGFVFYNGRFMTPERRERLRLDAAARRHLQHLSSSRAELRREAYAFFRQVPDLNWYTLYRRVLIERRKVLARRLAGSAEGKRLLALRERKKAFLERRRELLELIFDTYRYPYPHLPGKGASPEAYQRYLETQAILDRGVRELEREWESTQGAVVLGRRFREQYEQLREVQAELERFRGTLAVPPEPAATWLLALGDLRFYEPLRYRITLAVLPMDARERQLLEYNRRVLTYNERVASRATAPEREQVRITNRYRQLMGRRCLVLNDRILAAARGHCRDMAEKGYFAHEAPDPRRRTPRDRLHLVGYECISCGENLARGVTSPRTAHERWFHSPGHHRTLLAPDWQEMAAANVDSYWCQNFGNRGWDLEALLGKQPVAPSPRRGRPLRRPVRPPRRHP